VEDISERKHHEAELENSINSLSRLRRAGMAEVATGVLHNVGNVLNSVNVSAMLIVDRLSKSTSRISPCFLVVARERRGPRALPHRGSARTQTAGFIASLAERLGVEQTG
jgi:hypothetical protein